MSHVAEQTLCLDDGAHTPVGRVWIVHEIDFVLLNLWVGMLIVARGRLFVNIRARPVHGTSKGPVHITVRGTVAIRGMHIHRHQSSALTAEQEIISECMTSI